LLLNCVVTLGCCAKLLKSYWDAANAARSLGAGCFLKLVCCAKLLKSYWMLLKAGMQIDSMKRSAGC
jgi:hypothetical protein